MELGTVFLVLLGIIVVVFVFLFIMFGFGALFAMGEINKEAARQMQEQRKRELNEWVEGNRPE